jgi:hypothetical protein
MTLLLRGACWLLVPILAMALVPQPALFAQDVEEGEPLSEPLPGPPIEDRDFGVTTRRFGLDRQVEMYQWRASHDGYRRVWSTALIDASDFAPGHGNPPEFPLERRRWWSTRATLDGHPVDDEVLRALGEWRVFRPTFSRLPLNMAATFQPEGDGLGSAENPLQPQIGDLRIRWRELTLPPLQGKVVLRDGRWHLRPSAAPGLHQGGDGNDANDPASALDDDAPDVARGSSWPWWLGIGAMVLVLVTIRRRRRARNRNP